MSVPLTKLDEQVRAPSEEEIKVRLFKQRMLVHAGFSIKSAGEIAQRRDIDWHDAVRLLEKGCSPETAEKILL